MKIYKDISGFAFERPVATIGIFDGVHTAHQAIIKKLISKAEELRGESVVVTMWPHPRIVLQKESEKIFLLNTLEEKIDRIEESGIDNLVILPFDRTFASVGFNEFVADFLVRKLGIFHLVVGYNHHFGRNREGNFENLKLLSQELGFGLSQQDPVLIEDERISSSHIRAYILAGNVNKANTMLGYVFYLKGKVVAGNRVGKLLGFPTANLTLTDQSKIVPAKGVYAVIVEYDKKLYQGMMNIGCRPTIDHDCLQDVLEVNLFGFSGDLYNQDLRVFFIDRIRDEKKFRDTAELASQITKDKELIKNMLSQVNLENRKLVI